MKNKTNISGFTLLEISIVLVIIGLIVGGILAGKSLIDAAALRGQITQLEQFNVGAHTFQLKYNGLPGDLPDPDATAYGFTPRTGIASVLAGFPGPRGMGNGDGVIEGCRDGGLGSCQIDDPGIMEVIGETVTFWSDLSVAKLIGGKFDGLAGNYFYPGDYTVERFYPKAKLGNGNYVYIWSDNGQNYFGISAIYGTECFAIKSRPGISPSQAFNIDNKIDDGLPQSGNTLAQYLSGDIFGGTGRNESRDGPVWSTTADTSATRPTATTCYDNNNVGGAQQHYTLSQNGGNSLTCGISVKLQ